jgi:hypothetical protein
MHLLQVIRLNSSFTGIFFFLLPEKILKLQYPNKMKKIYIFLGFLLFIGKQLSAQFSGPYTPANWTLTLPPPSTGSVNTSSAPSSIIINGSNAGTETPNVDVSYTIATASAGPWSFSWSYHSNDLNPSYDLAGVLINGVFTQLSINAGTNDQTGTYSGTSMPSGTIIGFRVRSIDNAFGNATFTITNFSAPNLLLPVSLSKFTAIGEANSVKLNWTTETEQNSSHFDVQHSMNAKDFTSIAMVKAQINSTSARQYFSVHPSPSMGVNYYRLRMVDIDGNMKYSKIISVKMNVSISLNVFPNPAFDKLIISYNSSGTSGETFELYSADGRLLKTMAVFISPGINTIEVNTANLSNGFYRIKTSQTGQVISFVKK